MVRAIVGGNWGDEGKGKITDLLAEDSDFVVRFQGGANAGHTIINEYGRFALHLLPSGVFRSGVVNGIGPGVAFDLVRFFEELDQLEAAGVPAPKLVVSDRAQLLMSYHKLLDRLEEERLGAKQFGSTKSGIAPFYSDKALKTGIQVCDLFEPEELAAKVAAACESKNNLLQAVYHQDTLLDPESILAELAGYRDRLAPMVGDLSKMLYDGIAQGKNILLEGQLGALKDPDHGIFPFTTSSSTLAGYGAVGAGIPAREIREVITVVKAYSSAVGAGAFVSEIFGPEADELRRRGGDKGEFGATTGRPRRMGWFDVVATRYGCRLQGTTQVALTLLDVLSYMEEIPVCVAYEIDGQRVEDFPTTPRLNRAKPIIKRLPGFHQDIRGIRRYADLPDAAKAYVDFVEASLGFPIKLVSNGPAREDILFR
ncbi:MAG: adenylosuccinate synthase [Christensenellaceae bacterium]